MPDSPPTPVPGAIPTPRGGGGWLERYRLALAAVLVGLAATGLAGWLTHRWAWDRDAERFAADARMLRTLIEQKMERQELALARLRDVFAGSHGEVSSTDWRGWLATMDMPVNYPAVRCLLVAPRISAGNRETFLRRATNQIPGFPAPALAPRSNATHWAPVWRQYVRGDLEVPTVGEDLLIAGPRHPAFESALGATYGWVSGRHVVTSRSGGPKSGIWFVVSLRPLQFTNYPVWQLPNEPASEAPKRRWRQRAAKATGLLAAFIEGDRFLEEFNPTNHTQAVAAQLFTGKEAGPGTLVNPGHPPPLRPLLTLDQPMQWYGETWTLRCHSTPVFEASSLRYRTWLVWGVGTLLTLGMTLVVAWQIHGRLREAALAEQLRQALSRQERLSRDLHDGTLQSVYGVGLGLQRAQRLLAKRPDAAAAQLAGTALALQHVVGELRDFIRESDPTTREELRLGEALAGVVEHLRLATEMELSLEFTPGADEGLTPAEALDWLNIAREALSNAARHSRARRVRVRLERVGGRLRLEVADDGLGFDPVAAQESGRGLRNLAARVRDLGGVLHWEAGPGRGTRLVVDGPVQGVLERGMPDASGDSNVATQNGRDPRPRDADAGNRAEHRS